jgi:hydrogenase maturation factor
MCLFGRNGVAPEILDQIRDVEIRMADLVDLAIPANAQAAAEALGLKVHRSVTSGARVRQIPREEAEIALECLRDWGISARILEDALGGPRP